MHAYNTINSRRARPLETKYRQEDGIVKVYLNLISEPLSEIIDFISRVKI